MMLPNIPDRPIFPSIVKNGDSNAQHDPYIKKESFKSDDKLEPFLTSSNLNRDRESITLRGNLEILEKVLIDVVSELKYHRQQV